MIQKHFNKQPLQYVNAYQSHVTMKTKHKHDMMLIYKKHPNDVYPLSVPLRNLYPRRVWLTKKLMKTKKIYCLNTEYLNHTLNILSDVRDDSVTGKNDIKHWRMQCPY